MPGTEPQVGETQQAFDDLECPFADLVIPQMFQRVEQDLSKINPVSPELIVSFDPRYGYVTRYDRDEAGLSDAYVVFRFSQLTPLAPSAK